MVRRLAAVGILLAMTACSSEGDVAQEAPRSTPAATTGAPRFAGQRIEMSTGQLLYVPAYSHIYTRDQNRRVLLAVTLSIRNTDTERSLAVRGVWYYDSDGHLVATYLDTPRDLAPLATMEVVVAEADDSGGAGANFLVEWTADDPVTPPVVEAVMISTAGAQGISFTSSGRPLREAGP